MLCRGGLGGGRGDVLPLPALIITRQVGVEGAGGRPSMLSPVCVPGVRNSSHRRTSSSALNSCLCVRGYFPNYAQMEEKNQDFC